LDVALRPQLTILLAEPGQFLALGGRQTGPAVRAIGAGALHPLASGRLGQVQVARDGADGLAFVEHQPDDAGLEFVSELATRPSPLRCVGQRFGHRIPHRKDVHRIGSRPRARHCVDTFALGV